jgi:hypothetical protein
MALNAATVHRALEAFQSIDLPFGLAATASLARCGEISTPSETRLTEGLSNEH